MKRIVLAAILAALPSATVYSQAQTDKPAAAPAPAMKEEAKPAAPSPGMTGEAKPAAPQKEINIVQGPGQSVVKEDARHCLEHGDNTDIIKCAEPYLPTRRK
jgi:hypothetical protein